MEFIGGQEEPCFFFLSFIRPSMRMVELIQSIVELGLGFVIGSFLCYCYTSNFKFFLQWTTAVLYLDVARSARSFSHYSCPTLSFQNHAFLHCTDRQFRHILSPLFLEHCYCLIYGVKGKDFLSSPAQASVLGKSCVLGLLLLLLLIGESCHPLKFRSFGCIVTSAL